MTIAIVVSPTVQTGNQISAGVSAASVRPQSRTFSLTGLMGTQIVAGDVVAIWGSNDGGRTFQPLRQGENQVVQLNLMNPEVVIDDACDSYATQRVAVGAGSGLVAVGLNGENNGFLPGSWLVGGNSLGGLVGVLGTNDASSLEVRARGIPIIRSDGTTNIFGNPDAIAPGGAFFLAGGSGGGALSADVGGSISYTVDTGQHVFSGGDVRLVQNSAAAPTPLRFFEVGGNEFVGLRSPNALAAATEYVFPTTIANLPNRALISDGVAGEQQLSWGPAIESGAANLTNGVSAAIAANIAATSRIFIQAADVVPGAGNLTIDYRPLAADRVNGTPGSFKITAVLAAGTINVLDQSQGVQWMVLNQ